MTAFLRASAATLGVLLLAGAGLAQDTPFKRGDSDTNGQLNVADPIHTLGFLFLGGPAPTCKDAADTNDSGGLDITDPLVTLSFLFLGGPAPAMPWPACGIDPTADSLDCVQYENERPLCSANQAPLASFVARPTSGEAPLEVMFDATASTDPDGTIVSYAWDFGDSGTGSGDTVSHTFTGGGTFTVTLTVTDDESATSTATDVIVVETPLPPPTFEEEVHWLTNLEREREGLPPLKRQAQLEQAIEAHVQDMAENGYFRHTSPDGRKVPDRLTAVGYPWIAWGENIARGAETPEAVVAGWMNSPGHRANILFTPFTEMGVGYHFRESDMEHLWGQNFGARFEVFPVIIDTEAPRASSEQVDLYIYGEGWAEEMRVSNDPGFEGSEWQPYRERMSWTLSPGSGSRTVHVQLRRGMQVKAAEDSIVLAP